MGLGRGLRVRCGLFGRGRRGIGGRGSLWRRRGAGLWLPLLGWVGVLSRWVLEGGLFGRCGRYVDVELQGLLLLSVSCLL